MIVFKTFLKVVNKCKVPILLYTVLLIFFGGFNYQNNDTNTTFTDSKPDIYIINHDKEEGITKGLIKYMTANSNVKDIQEEDLKDAIFYRDINYLIEIPENFNEDFINKRNPEIKIETTKDYPAQLASNLLNRYLKTAKVYLELDLSEEELESKIASTLESEITVEVTSKLDTNNLVKAKGYFNFLNYCLLAGSIYVICLVLTSFKKETIKKRTEISSINYKKFNRYLLLSNSLFGVVLWLLYIILSFILVGSTMFTAHGLIFIINSFVFSVFTLTLAFCLGNLVNNKEAINGIVNVVALGSSFLCGSFVPMEWLPDSVLKIAHILPSYYYIKNNELIVTLENINAITLKPIIINMIIMLTFAGIFVILTNIISKRKRKIG